MRQEASEQQQQDADVRLAVLENRVTNLERSGEHREDRLCALEAKLSDLADKLEEFRSDIERRLGEVQVASWRQFWGLAAVVVGATVGMAVWLSQQLLAHVVAK